MPFHPAVPILGNIKKQWENYVANRGTSPISDGMALLMHFQTWDMFEDYTLTQEVPLVTGVDTLHRTVYGLKIILSPEVPVSDTYLVMGANHRDLQAKPTASAKGVSLTFTGSGSTAVSFPSMGYNTFAVANNSGQGSGAATHGIYQQVKTPWSSPSPIAKHLPASPGWDGWTCDYLVNVWDLTVHQKLCKWYKGKVITEKVVDLGPPEKIKVVYSSWEKNTHILRGKGDFECELSNQMVYDLNAKLASNGLPPLTMVHNADLVKPEDLVPSMPTATQAPEIKKEKLQEAFEAKHQEIAKAIGVVKVDDEGLKKKITEAESAFAKINKLMTWPNPALPPTVEPPKAFVPPKGASVLNEKAIKKLYEDYPPITVNTWLPGEEIEEVDGGYQHGFQLGPNEDGTITE